MSSRNRRRRQQDPRRARARPSALRGAETKHRRSRLLGALAAALTLGGVGAGSAIALSGGAAGAKSPQTRLDVEPASRLGSLEPPPLQDMLGPEGVAVPRAAVLASTDRGAAGSPVDGVSCDTSEQVVYHIHAHLTVFVNGVQRQVPPGIGVPVPQAEPTPQGPFVVSGACFYWLHTHAADGIIHVESPAQRRYTLGQFFDLWGQVLSPTRVGDVIGRVVAFYNGGHVLSDPRAIPLTAHADIQLDVGAPLVGPVVVPSWGGL